MLLLRRENMSSTTGRSAAPERDALHVRAVSQGILVFLLALGCGKTPDSLMSESGGTSGSSGGSGSGGATSSGGTAASGGSASAARDGSSTAFACTGTAPTGELVPVPAGPFAMGCDDKLDTACTEAEKPPRSVTLAAFEIDRTEVTQGAYTACLLAKACTPPSCDWSCAKTSFPAACVTWQQASSYCTWAGKRLPTEAEWEKAARGADGRKYPWGNQDPDCTLVNMAGCGDRADAVGSHPTGQSPYGALDMAGNVVELVEDFYDESYYESAPASDPKGPASGSRYVGRGGGYASVATWQRASSRDWYDATDASKPLGFRCAR
jgi:formylglycine-generating enzyme required for sulfatase activity